LDGPANKKLPGRKGAGMAGQTGAAGHSAPPPGGMERGVDAASPCGGRGPGFSPVTARRRKRAEDRAPERHQFCVPVRLRGNPRLDRERVPGEGGGGNGGALVSTWERRQRRHAEDDALAS